MSKKEKKMSKSGKIDHSNRDLPSLDVKIIQYSLVSEVKFWDNPNRNAPFWRFYRTVSPGASISFGDKKIDLVPGEAVIIPPNFTYSSFAAKSFSQFYMHFYWNSAVITEPAVIAADDGLMDIAAWEDFLQGSDALLALRMYSLLLHYLQKISFCENQLSLDSRLLEAIELMNKDNSLNNRQIAKFVHMTCDTFQRLFKRQLGISVHQYMLARRMEKAQILLNNPELSIDQIAQTIGFCNRYQFTKSFTAYFKVSPGAYRKRLKQ